MSTEEIAEIRFDTVEGLEETFAASTLDCGGSGNHGCTTIAL